MVQGAALRENLLFSLGDTLLVVIAEVDGDFLTKYGLKKEYQVLPDADYSELFNELTKRYKVIGSHGGSAFLTLKVFQWVLNTKVKVSTYFGSKGNDEVGRLFDEDVKDSNVDAYFQNVEGLPTGVTLSLMYDNKYWVATYLGAGRRYSKEKHLDLPENWKLVEKADYYYLCSFTLVVSPEPLLKVGKHAAETNKPFTLNLSQVYVVRNYKDSLLEVTKYADVLFGSENEARAFSEVYGYNTDDLNEIVKKMQALPKVNTKRQRVVVVTRNKNDTVVATSEGVKLYPVEALGMNVAFDNIRSLCVFCGGFLSQFVQGKPLEDCVRAGHYTSSVILKQVGYTLPDFKPEFK